MALIDKMQPMEPMSTRQVVGQIIRGLISARGWDYQDAPPHMAMSLTTLNRMMRGETVRPAQYRKAEHALDLPTFLLDRVIEGDVAAIRALDMDAALKQYILSALQAVNPGPQRRRKGDV
jgi:hypothetical protein